MGTPRPFTTSHDAPHDRLVGVNTSTHWRKSVGPEIDHIRVGLAVAAEPGVSPAPTLAECRPRLSQRGFDGAPEITSYRKVAVLLRVRELRGVHW